MPTRIRLFGDTQQADQYRSQAYRKHLADALKLRSFQGLPIYRHQVRIAGGGVVDIVCHHNMNEIAIYMPPRPQPVQERPEMPGAGNLLILLGDEFVGYHFMLWDAYSNVQISEIQTADKLEEIYQRFPPARDQDDLYVYGTQAGLHHINDFKRYDYNTFPEALFGNLGEVGNESDSFTVEYEHPVDGTVSCEAKLDQVDHNNDESLEFDGPQRFVGFKEHMLSLDQTFTHDLDYTDRFVYRMLDRDTGTFAGKLPSTILVKNFPTIEGNHYNVEADQITETAHRNYRVSKNIFFPNWTPIRVRDWFETVHSWKTPVGKLKLRRRNPQSDVDASKPWRFSYWDYAMTSEPEDSDETMMIASLRAGQERSIESRLFYPNVEKKNSYSFPDSGDGNSIGNKTLDFRYSSSKGLAFQIFTMSLVEWAGKPQSEGSTSWDEIYKADCTRVAAACGLLAAEDDPAQMQRSSALEEAVAQLIDQALEDQREAGLSNEHEHYHGYIHGYFFDTGIGNIYEYPRSRDAERMKLLKLVNQTREDNGLEPVKYSWDLEKAATRFTFDMIDDLHIGHTGQDGSDALQRHEESGCFINAEIHTTEMEDTNTLPRGGGENTGYGPSHYTAEQIHEAWMNSSEHRANILDSTWNNGMFGADFREGSDGNTYWAEEFAFNPNY